MFESESLPNLDALEYVESHGHRIPKATPFQLLRAHAEREPDALAVSFLGGEEFTYSELAASSARMAEIFVKLGLEKGDRIATLLYNCPTQVEVFLACGAVGTILVPLNASSGPFEFVDVLNRTQARVLVFGNEFTELVQKCLPELIDPPILVVDGDVDVSGVRSMSELVSLAAGRESFDRGVDYRDPACILFTGGTTGAPKGVLRGHFSYLCSGVRYGEIIGVERSDRHFALLQLFHTGGQDVELMGPLLYGIPVQFRRWFSASQFWADVQAFGATTTVAVGAVVKALLLASGQESGQANPLRLVIGVTQGVPNDDIERFKELYQVRFLDIYGMTETGSVIFSNHHDSTRERSVGKSWGWCDVEIQDDDGFAVPYGEVGEIALRPNVPGSVSMGYFGDAPATVERWRNLWIHTGDLGRVDAEGWLTLEGRKSHWVRIRGENVSCFEVENVVGTHPDVAECAAIGVPSPFGEQELALWVVTRDGASLEARAVAEFAAERLAYFKIPRFIGFADALPRTITKGEVERHRLAEREVEEMWDRIEDGTILGRRPQREGERA